MSFGAHLIHVGHEIEERGWGGVFGAIGGIVITGAAVTTLFRPGPPGPGCDIVSTSRVGPFDWAFHCADGRLIRSEVEAGLAPYVIGALVGAIIGKILWDFAIERLKTHPLYC